MHTLTNIQIANCIIIIIIPIVIYPGIFLHLCVTIEGYMNYTTLIFYNSYDIKLIECFHYHYNINIIPASNKLTAPPKGARFAENVKHAVYR